MKKKLLTAVLTLVAVLCLCIGVSACGKVVYKLDFIVDGETYATINTKGNEEISLPEDPKKEDYLFDGWYWDEGIWQRPFTADSLLHEKLTSNMSVYAKWVEEDITKRSYIITFNSMGGSTVEATTVLYGRLLTEPQKPTKTGYVFVGWYKEADCSTKWNFASDTITEDITLYAKWVDESDATGCEILTADGFVREGNILSIRTANANEHFALSSAITVSPYANWTVTTDIAGRNEIPSATVDLRVGDNTFYINVVSGNGSNKKQFTVNIHRRYMFTVTYQPNNGEEQIVESVEEDSVLENKTVTKRGYTFVEWQNENVTWDFETPVSESVVLNATWNVNEYKVTFNSNGGSDISEQIATFDDEFEFEVPTKLGYTFGGWKTSEGTVLTNAEGKGLAVWDIDSEVELEAVWTTVQYTITYNNVAGASNPNLTQFTVEDGSITLLNALKDGYTFEGWYREETFDNKVETVDATAAQSVELWAKWTAITYTATFMADQSEVQKVSFTMDDESIQAPNVPSKDGYSGEWEEYSIVPRNITVNAVYTPITYTIEYTGTKTAENPNRTSYTIETPTFELTDLSLDGYTFDGWYENNNKITEITIGTFGQKTIEARWSTITYNLTFDYEEAIGKYPDSQSNRTTYTVEDTFTFVELESKVEGYTFDGWYTAKNDGDGEKVEGIVAGTTGHKTYYAHWKLEEYQITYHNMEGVTNTNPTYYTVASNDITIEDVSRLGYDFGGWYSDADLQTKADTTIEQGSHGARDFYAKWTPIVYTLTFNAYGGTYTDGENRTSYTIEDEFEFVNPVLDHYRFDGWFTEATGGDLVTGIELGTTGTKTFYAHWTHITTITYNSRNGSEVSPTVQPAGTQISQPTPPTRDYYDFAGWYTEEACQNEYQFDTMPEQDFTLYAKWTPIEYTIHYELYGGDNAQSNPATYNVEQSVTFAAPTKTGYTFNAWYTSADFSEMTEGIVVGSHGEITVYASFSVNQYTITFHSNDGTTVEPITQNYDTVLTPPTNPSKTGYSFDGWYTEAGLQHRFVFEKMPADNIDLWAKWTLVEYEINYHLDSGNNNAANPETYNIEDSDVTLQDPSKTGYTFVGWYSDSNYLTEFESIPQGSYGQVEVYAKWQIIEYEIHYVLPEGAVNPNLTTYTIETDITDLQPAELKGYHFDGWFEEQTFQSSVSTFAGGTIGELTFYGKFTPNEYTVWLGGTDEASGNVSFDLNGAEGVPPQTQHITEQDGLTYPEIPTRTGYLFGGWYANQACEGTPYDFSGNVGGDFTLYAKWIELGDGATAISVGGSVTVTLHGKEEQIYRFVPLVSGNISITTQGDIDTLGTLYRGDTLIRQDDDSGNDEKNFLIVYNVTAGTMYEIRVRGFSASASGTTSLTISGTNKPVDGGKTHTGNRTTVTFGSENFELGVPDAGDLEKFLGWEDVDGILYTDGTGKAVRAWDHDNTTVLFAKWEHMTYTVTFVTNGGSNVNDTNTISLDYGARLDINLYVTVWAGHTFTGWYLNGSDQDPYNASTMPDRDLTLYAGWKTFALGSIKYDQDKQEVSEYDEITNDTVADLFDLVCLDTDGKPATYTVNVQGSQTAGNTVTITITATSGNKSKRITLSNIKVYGNPTITVNKSDKNYINPDEFTAAAWGASGKDTYNNDTTIEVTLDGEHSYGEYVTVVISSIDIAGNVTEQRIDNVMYYGAPTIDYNEDKASISVDDELVGSLFDAEAKDSFNQPLDLTVYLYSGTISAGESVVLRFITTDSKGNTYYFDLTVAVYGTPTIEDATKTDFRVDDNITVESLGLQAQDTYGEPLVIALTHTGTQSAGETMIYTATVTDIAGNVATKEIPVRIFGSPTITYGRTDIKNTEDPTTVTVSFNLNGAEGNPPVSQVVTSTVGLVYPAVPTREDGYVFGGWYTTSDCAGDPFDFTQTVTQDITLYAKWVSYSGAGYILINGSKTVQVYSRNSSSNGYYAFVPLVDGQIRIYSSNNWDTYGYLYSASKSQLASDDQSGGNGDFLITYSVKAGTLYYAKPAGYSSSGTVTLHVDGALPESSGLGTSNSLQVTAKDSFGQDISYTVTLKNGTFEGGQTVVYTITATDHLGNSTTIDTAPIKVYSADDIDLNYSNRASDLIKLTSHGEEFAASATDSFGAPCTLSIEAAEGFSLEAGQTISLYIVATDAAGNVVKSELISNIRVFGIPELVEQSTFIDEDTDLDYNYIITDSFGDELVPIVTVTGDQTAGNTITVHVEATDDAGNLVEHTYTYLVAPAPHTEHTLDWVVDVQATCTQTGHRYQKCTQCDYRSGVEETLDMLPHEFQEDHTCQECGQKGFVVTFNLNGGNGDLPPAQTITEERGLVYPTSFPTRSGYVFTSWYSNEEGTGAPFDFTSNVLYGTVLYAGWKPMVTSGYHSRSNIDIINRYNSENTAYSESTASTSSSAYNYVYFTAMTAGTYRLYYKNSSSNSYYKTYLFIYNVTKGSTIYSSNAISNTTYSSTSFTANAGDVIYVRTYRYNTSYTATFSFYVTGGQKPADGGLASVDSIYSYTVSFNLNGADGEVPEPQIVTEGMGLVYPEAPTWNEHIFTGWYTSSECTALYDFDEPILSDIMLYAGWDTVPVPSSYATWEYVDITSYNSSSNRKTVNITAASSDQQNYYYFICYANGSYNFYAAYTTGDFYITVYNATKKSTILSQYNLYSSHPSQSASFTANAGDVVYVSLYKFSSSGSTGTGTFYVTLDAKEETLTPKTVQVAIYKVCFDLNGAVSTAPVTQYLSSNSALTYPTIPTWTGHAFRGWFVDADCSTLYDFSAPVTSNITLYAGWQDMETINKTRTWINIANSYNTSNNAYSISTSGTSATNCNYTYFTALTTGTYSVNYKISSSSCDTWVYIYNVTQGTVIRANAYIKNTSYSNSYRTVFTANAGDVIYVRSYMQSSSTTFYMYVEGGTLPTAGGVAVLNNEVGTVLAVDPKALQIWV